MSAYLQETLGGIKLVRSFGQERRHRERFRELNTTDGEAQLSTKSIAFGRTASARAMATRSSSEGSR